MPTQILVYSSKELGAKYDVPAIDIQVMGKYLKVKKLGNTMIWTDKQMKSLEKFIGYKSPQPVIDDE